MISLAQIDINPGLYLDKTDSEEAITVNKSIRKKLFNMQDNLSKHQLGKLKEMIRNDQEYGKDVRDTYFAKQLEIHAAHQYAVDQVLVRYEDRIEALTQRFHEDDRRLINEIQKARTDAVLEFFATSIEFAGEFALQQYQAAQDRKKSNGTVVIEKDEVTVYQQNIYCNAKDACVEVEYRTLDNSSNPLSNRNAPSLSTDNSDLESMGRSTSTGAMEAGSLITDSDVMERALTGVLEEIQCDPDSQSCYPVWSNDSSSEYSDSLKQTASGKRLFQSISGYLGHSPGAIAKEATSAAFDIHPVTGPPKAALEVVVGRDLVTGKKVPRWVAALGLVPTAGGGTKVAVKAGKAGGRFIIRVGKAVPRNIPTNSKKLIKELRKDGWVLTGRGKGSHEVLKHPKYPEIITVPKNTNLPKGTLHQISKTARWR